MPMLLGTKGEEILQWRASRELVEGIEAQLAKKWGRSAAGEAREFLAGVIASLEEELAYESQLEQELSSLQRECGAAATAQELSEVNARHREVVSAHFSRRGSVLALCGARGAMQDALVLRAAELAEERMSRLGQGRAPVYALLCSGDRARDEETLYGCNRYLLLHELDSQSFSLFGRQLLALLLEAGLVDGEYALWRGSLAEWRASLKGPQGRRREHDGESFAPLPPFAAAEKQRPAPLASGEWRLEAMADLCPVAGFEPLAAKAKAAAAAALKEQTGRDPFFQLARGVIHLPLALGHFGRWRVEREGEHRYEIDMERLALSPLVMAVRVMAAHAGVHEGGTADRVRSLLYKGLLDVDLAGRLLKAFQCLMQLKVQSEIRTEGAGAYANPEEFTPEQDERVREAVESVLNLQKIAYQRLVGQV